MYGVQLIRRNLNDPTTFGDKAVAWWTAKFSDKFNGKWRFGYSHCELYFPNNNRMFSASQYENKVRFKNKLNVGSNWEIIKIYKRWHRGYNNLMLSCDLLLDKKYDYLGIFGFIIPKIKQDKNKWFCSEVCAFILDYNKLEHFDKPFSKYSPNSLALTLNK